jgi:small subunit ribosomal protein S5
MAGRRYSFSAGVIVGNRNGFIGLGTAKDRERLAAIKKAARKARLNLVKIRRGCGSWECTCGTQHSVPFKVEGKSASVRVILMPAPRGTGLCAGKNIQKTLELAGIKDVWVKTRGATDTTLNFVRATIDALKKTMNPKLSNEILKKIETQEKRDRR